MGETRRPRIGLVHAYALSMPPILSSFAALWPEAQTVNLLDESLYLDVDPGGVLSAEIDRRVATLLRHACETGADGLIFTGATFGPAVDLVRPSLPVPVLKADEAMCEELAERRGRVAILCTAARALPVIRRGVEAAARMRGGGPSAIEDIFVEGAKGALEAGDAASHDRLIAERLDQLKGFEAVALGQISMAGARRFASQGAAHDILVSPDCSVRAMRRLLS